MFLLAALDEEGSGFAKKDVDYGHTEEVFGCSDVGALDSIAKEDIAHDEEIDIAAMCGDNDQRTLILIMCFDLRNRILINHYSLINRLKQFSQKPSEHADRVHRVVTKHLHTHLLCNFIQLLLCLFKRSRSILQFQHTLLHHSFDRFFD